MKFSIFIILGVLIGFAFATVLSLIIFGGERSILGISTTANRILVAIKPLDMQLSKSNTEASAKTLGINTQTTLLTSHKLTSDKLPFPLIVPTSGISPDRSHLYDPINHAGVDIWSNISGFGNSGPNTPGNPIYAACSGRVVRIFEPNEEIEIVCDPISYIYNNLVPSLQIKTLYSHLGDAASHQPYHKLHIGQYLERGELIGYQGNISSFNPQNRITHLHFGIYDLSKPGRPPLDPEAYIGVSTTTLDQKFNEGQN